MPKGVEQITRTRKAKVDKLKPQTGVDDDVATYGNCEVLPRQPIETDRGQVGVEGWDVYCFDASADVIRTDLVELRGQSYNVVGEPRRFTKRGRFKALQITLSKVS